MFDGTWTNSVVNPVDNTIAIATYNGSTVVIVDPAAGTATLVTDTNTDIDNPYGLAYSPDGAKLYVANYGTDTVSVIDTATKSVVDNITVNNSENIDVAVTPDGTTLLVTDDYDEIAAYDLSSPGSALWSTGVDGDWNQGIYFNADGTALLVDYYGALQTVTLSNGNLSTLIDATTNAAAYSTCANADHSVLAMTADDSNLYLINGVTGASIGSIDLTAQGALNLRSCAFTSQGQIVLTDYGYSSNNDYDGSGQTFIVDSNTKAWIETVTMPDVAYTSTVSVIAGCVAVVGSAYTNLATVALDSSYCTAPELPSTGIDESVLGGSAIAALSLMIGGVVMIAAVRRRKA